MRRLSIVPASLALLVLLSAATVATAAPKRLIVPNTDTVFGSVGVVGGQLVVYDPDTGQYSLDNSLNIPLDGNGGVLEVDAVHKLSNPGQFLFSLRDGAASTDDLAATHLGGVQVRFNDIIRYDGESGYSFFFRNFDLPAGFVMDPGANIDAIYIDGSDETGDLVVSLDVPRELGDGMTYSQNDLIRWVRTGPGPGDWQLSGKAFDATNRIPSNMNVVGAALGDGEIVLAVDIPEDLQPSPSHNPYDPGVGQLATWNGSEFSMVALSPFIPDSATEARVNSLAEPPAGCAVLGSPNTLDQVVDLCGVTWLIGASPRFRMEWLDMTAVTQYNVYRGSRADLCDLGLALSLVTTTSNTYYIELDPTTDTPGEAYFYQISALPGNDLGCANPVDPGCVCNATCSGCCARTLVAPGACP